MKKVLWAVVFLAGIFANQKAMGLDGACCAPTNLHGAIYVDYLYWNYKEPATIASSFDIENSLLTVQYLDTSYQSNYRIGANLYCNCLNFEVRYTDIHNHDSETILDDFDASGSLEYKSVDLNIGYVFSWCCSSSYIKPFVGAKLGWIEKRSTVVQPTLTLNVDRQIDGYGLILGVEGLYNFFNCNCLTAGFYARGNYGIVYTTNKQENANVGGSSSIYIPFNNYQSLHEVAVGLQIGYTGFSCVCPSILIAYETQQWSDQESLGILNLGGLVTRFQLGF